MAKVLLNNELLRTFVAVAERRSFTQAAGALFRTQSAVSMQIKRLESSLGVRLFHRGAQCVELSSAGNALLNHARRMLALNDEAVAQLSAASMQRALRIGVMEDYGSSVLQPALTRLVAAVPGVRIEVSTGLTSLMLKRLGSDFDLVIAMHPAGHNDGTLLYREQAMWASGPGCRVGGRGPIALALYREGCLLRTWATEALDAIGKAWHLGFVGESAETVQSIAAKGKMLTVVKSSMFPWQLLPVAARLGLPQLPAAEVRLHRAPMLSRSDSVLADRLSGLLQPSLQS